MSFNASAFKATIRKTFDSEQASISLYLVSRKPQEVAVGQKKENECYQVSFDDKSDVIAKSIIRDKLMQFLELGDDKFLDMSQCFDNRLDHVYSAKDTDADIKTLFSFFDEEGGIPNKPFDEQNMPVALIFKVFTSTGSFLMFRRLPQSAKLKNKYIVFRHCRLVSSGFAIDGNFDAIKLGNDIVITNVKSIQTFCGLDEYIEEANRPSIEKLRSLNIIEKNSDQVLDTIRKTGTMKKKLLSARNLDVINSPKDRLLRGLHAEKRYRILITNDKQHISLSNATNINLFLDAINDSVVHSYLSQNTYNSMNKMKVENNEPSQAPLAEPGKKD